MGLKEDILEEIGRYSNFVNGVVEEDFEQYTREELETLKKEIQKIYVGGFVGNINKTIKKKKEQEYPQLTRAYNYPVLNNVDFLSEQDIIRLDRFLARFARGNYLYGLQNSGIDRTKQQQTIEWLEKNKIIERFVAVVCTECSDGNVTEYFEENELGNFYAGIRNQDEDSEENKYVELVRTCDNCWEDVDLESIVDGVYTKRVHKVMVDRDKSLDKV